MDSSGSGEFIFSSDTRVVADPEALGAIAPFLAVLRLVSGYPLPVEADEAGAEKIIFLLNSDFNHPEEYVIEVTPDVVRVSGRTPHAIFNATQTLRQLLPAVIEVGEPALADWRLPTVTIRDWPEYEYRGLMIDVARSFLTVEEMKQIIDLASSAKISRLHWHLSDDQGWRIEITNDGRADGDEIDYTRLTAVSGNTAMTERGYNGEPGHTIGALAAIPQLNTAGSSHEGTPAQPVCPPDGSVEVGHSYLDPHAEVTYTFARHVLRQLAAITPRPYLHIGGDEPLKMTERYGKETYLDCVARLGEIVREVGKQPAGWNELAEANAAPGTLVQYWQGETDATIAAAKSGATIILPRGESSYLDQKYFSDFPVGLDWACKGDCDFPRYYSWEPRELVPDLPPEQIAGVEGPLWSETLRGVSQVLLMAFPRLYALAELAWSDPNTRSLEGFTTRVGQVAPRLLLAGGNFYDGDKANWAPQVIGFPATAGEGRARVARIVAPGGDLPDVTLELDGAMFDLVTVGERGPLHAAPIVDVYADLSTTAAGAHGRIVAGEVSAPVEVR